MFPINLFTLYKNCKTCLKTGLVCTAITFAAWVYARVSCTAQHGGNATLSNALILNQLSLLSLLSISLLQSYIN